MKILYRLRAAVGAGALLILGLAACGGGGAGPVPVAMATSIPTTGPTNSPTNSPTGAPTNAPTIAPQAIGLGAAPSGILTATGALSLLRSSDLYVSRRGPQSSLVPNTIPPVVWSYSANANWGSVYGQLVTWAFNTTTSATLPETNLNASSSTAITVQSTNADHSPNFYGLTNDWLVTYNSPTATGQSPTSITFVGPNAVSGSVPVDVYDTFYTGCPGSTPLPPIGNVYQSGAPKPTATLGTGDVQIDCAGANLQFPLGAVLASQPLADSTGNILTTITSITAAASGIPSTLTSFPISGLKVGQVYVSRTQDGQFAKFEILVATASGSTSSVSGISWHSKADGSYAM